MVDLEHNGKAKRQKGRDTVISAHMFRIYGICEPIYKHSLLVRINPINSFSKEEINEVIDAGADAIMLPFFKQKEEVEYFVELLHRVARFSCFGNYDSYPKSFGYTKY